MLSGEWYMRQYGNGCIEYETIWYIWCVVYDIGLNQTLGAKGWGWGGLGIRVPPAPLHPPAKFSVWQEHGHHWALELMASLGSGLTLLWGRSLQHCICQHGLYGWGMGTSPCWGTLGWGLEMAAGGNNSYWETLVTTGDAGLYWNWEEQYSGTS